MDRARWGLPAPPSPAGCSAGAGCSPRLCRLPDSLSLRVTRRGRVCLLRVRAGFGLSRAPSRGSPSQLAGAAGTPRPWLESGPACLTVREAGGPGPGAETLPSGGSPPAPTVLAPPCAHVAFPGAHVWKDVGTEIGGVFRVFLSYQGPTPHMRAPLHQPDASHPLPQAPPPIALLWGFRLQHRSLGGCRHGALTVL